MRLQLRLPMTRNFVLLLALAPSLVSAQSLPARNAVARPTDSPARAFVESGASPSGVVRRAGAIALGARGNGDLDHDVDATAKSVYRTGSVTRQFTART